MNASAQECPDFIEAQRLRPPRFPGAAAADELPAHGARLAAEAVGPLAAGG